MKAVLHEPVGRRWLIAALLLWQVALPIWQMAHGSLRFDWAMFAFPRPLPILEVRTGSVLTDTLDLGKFVGYSRGDVTITDRDLPELCRVAGHPAQLRLALASDSAPRAWHACR